MYEFDGTEEYCYCAGRWRDALEKANSALVDLRAIYPLHTYDLTETSSRSIDDAMVNIKDGIVDLHRAGRHVLGVEEYEKFMEWRSENAVAEYTREETSI